MYASYPILSGITLLLISMKCLKLKPSLCLCQFKDRLLLEKSTYQSFSNELNLFLH